MDETPWETPDDPDNDKPDNLETVDVTVVAKVAMRR